MKLQDHWSETNRRIFNLLEGGTKYVVGCLECQDKRDTFEPFTTLRLTLQDKSSYRDGTASLETLLHERLSYEELLDKENKVECAFCDKRTTTSKKMRLTTPPSILAIQLKRFEWTDFVKPNQKKQVNKVEGKKLQTHVTFTEELALQGESTDGELTTTHYKLKAVIEHVGTSSPSGHYFAMTKPDSEGKLWTYYSDTICNQ